MSRLAVLASGSGSNFERLVEAVRGSGRHECVLLLYDRKAAGAAGRALRLGVPSRHISYVGRPREAAEAELQEALATAQADLVALAGFMRILGPGFVSAWEGRLVNLHPSLLPAYPGAGAIHRAYAAGDKIVGVSVHFVDKGMDTGPLIAQDSIQRKDDESEADLEARMHALEHRLYPAVVLDLLDELGTRRMGS